MFRFSSLIIGLLLFFDFFDLSVKYRIDKLPDTIQHISYALKPRLGIGNTFLLCTIIRFGRTINCLNRRISHLIFQINLSLSQRALPFQTILGRQIFKIKDFFYHFDYLFSGLLRIPNRQLIRVFLILPFNLLLHGSITFGQRQFLYIPLFESIHFFGIALITHNLFRCITILYLIGKFIGIIIFKDKPLPIELRINKIDIGSGLLGSFDFRSPACFYSGQSQIELLLTPPFNRCQTILQIDFGQILLIFRFTFLYLFHHLLDKPYAKLLFILGITGNRIYFFLVIEFDQC